MAKQAGKKDWDKIIERLNGSNTGRKSIEMGSPGSAQVTRVRLLQTFSNLKCTTEGAVLKLSVAA